MVGLEIKGADIVMTYKDPEDPDETAAFSTVAGFQAFLKKLPVWQKGVTLKINIR